MVPAWLQRSGLAGCSGFGARLPSLAGLECNLAGSSLGL